MLLVHVSIGAYYVNLMPSFFTVTFAHGRYLKHVAGAGGLMCCPYMLGHYGVEQLSELLQSKGEQG
jgi:hypothetical protein